MNCFGWGGMKFYHLRPMGTFRRRHCHPSLCPCWCHSSNLSWSIWWPICYGIGHYDRWWWNNCLVEHLPNYQMTFLILFRSWNPVFFLFEYLCNAFDPGWKWILYCRCSSSHYRCWHIGHCRRRLLVDIRLLHGIHLFLHLVPAQGGNCNGMNRSCWRTFHPRTAPE